MNYLLTSTTTPTPQITPPQAPPMVALTCQLRNSTRSTTPNSTNPTFSPCTGRPTPRRSPGPIFLPANIYKLLSDVAIKELKKHIATTRSTPPPKRAVNTHDTAPHSEQPPTDTPTGDQAPADSPADPDLDNTEQCEAFTFDDSTLEHIMDTYSPLTLSIKTSSTMCLNTPLLIMDLLLIGEPMVELALSLTLTTMNFLV